MKVIQMKAVKIPVMKKRENVIESQRQSIERKRKRNINTNIENHQKTPIATVIQGKSIQRKGRVRDDILVINMSMEGYRQRNGAEL